MLLLFAVCCSLQLAPKGLRESTKRAHGASQRDALQLIKHDSILDSPPTLWTQTKLEHEYQLNQQLNWVLGKSEIKRQML